MTKLGYDPSANSTAADRHGPAADRYRHISADPVLAMKAAGSRGATIVPKATAAGGSSVKRPDRVIHVLLEQSANNTRTVEVHLDRLKPGQMERIMAQADSAKDVWQRLALEQEAESNINPTGPSGTSGTPGPALGGSTSSAYRPEQSTGPSGPGPNDRGQSLPLTLPPQSSPAPWGQLPVTPAAPPPTQAAWTPPDEPRQLPVDWVAEKAQLQLLIQQLRQAVPVNQPLPAAEPASRPQPAQPRENPFSHVGLNYLGYPDPVEPQHQVIFNLGEAGLMAGYYHAVSVNDRTVILEFDTRCKIQQYVPKKSNHPISLVVINQMDRTQKSLPKVYATDLKFRVGCLDICLLLVEDGEAEETPRTPPGMHTPVTLSDVLAGAAIPDELPEHDHGKTRRYQS